MKGNRFMSWTWFLIKICVYIATFILHWCDNELLWTSRTMLLSPPTQNKFFQSRSSYRIVSGDSTVDGRRKKIVETNHIQLDTFFLLLLCWRNMRKCVRNERQPFSHCPCPLSSQKWREETKNLTHNLRRQNATKLKHKSQWERRWTRGRHNNNKIFMLFNSINKIKWKRKEKKNR